MCRLFVCCLGYSVSVVAVVRAPLEAVVDRHGPCGKARRGGEIQQYSTDKRVGLDGEALGFTRTRVFPSNAMMHQTRLISQHIK